jgi:hypothetical protein
VNGASDIVPILLLMVFGLAVSIGMGIVVFVLRRARPEARMEPGRPVESFAPSAAHPGVFHRPDCWLAIKSRDLFAVQAALGLHNPRPCSCFEGLAGEKKLFITPPIKGWILVVGSGVPDPIDDVDSCFRFVNELSRKLGQVQLFSVCRILQHHGWVQVERGKVRRAYVWAGHTLWKQGTRTRAEKELNFKCFDYGETEEVSTFTAPEGIASNVDKLPLLAASWSLDPALIDQRLLEVACGIAGESSRRF